MRKFKVFKLIMILLFVMTFSGCATLSGSLTNMTPAQKYDTYRTTFNDVIQYQYLPWAKIQPESTKVILRTEVNNMIKTTEKALDVYGKEIAIPGGDPEAKMNLYLDIKNDLFALLLKYGLEVDESKGAPK